MDTQLKSSSNKSGQYTYIGRSWKALPIDFSLKEFADLHHLNSSHIRRALERACPRENKDASKLYYHIFFEKKGVSEETYKYNAPQKNAPDRDTSPVGLYWEIEPLIEQIDLAARDNKKAVSNDLISAAFKNLGHDLAIRDHIDSDYRSLQLLKNHQIRTAILDEYIEKIEQRTSAILNCLKEAVGSESIDSQFLPSALCYTAQKLDILLIRLSHYPQKVCEETDAARELDMIYNNLMSVRKQCEYDYTSQAALQEQIKDSALPHMYFGGGNSSKALCDLLHKVGCKSISPENREKIESTYNTYLVDCIKDDMPTEIMDYIRNFYRLRDYTNNITTEDALEETLREHFSTELKAHFEDLDNCNFTAYTYEPTSSENMASAAKSELAQTALQNILFQLHEPFRLLRIASAVQCFGYGQDHSEKVVDLIEHIKQETCKLAKSYQTLPLIFTENYKDQAAVDHLIEKYTESSADFQIKETPAYEKILRIPEPEPLILQLAQWRAFLRTDCFVVACDEAKKSIPEILDECKKLTALLAEQ